MTPPEAIKTLIDNLSKKERAELFDMLNIVDNNKYLKFDDSFPSIRDMFDQANFTYTHETQSSDRNVFIAGAKWCRELYIRRYIYKEKV